MESEYHTDFMEVQIERNTTKWYNEFTEYWTCSVAVDAENASGKVKYSVRIVGPNGEAAREAQLDQDSVPPEVRAKFEDMFRDSAKIV